MGIKFRCPNGHKLNVKSFLAGKRGVCPDCGQTFRIPPEDLNDKDYVAMPLESRRNGAPADVTVDRLEESEFEAAIAVAAAAVAAPAPARPAVPAAPLPIPTARQAEGPFYIGPETVPSPAALAPVATPGSKSLPASPALPPPPPFPPAPADPIAEAPAAVWYVRPPSGGQYGPAKGEVMRKWIAEGRVSADSLVWREDWADWRDAGKLFPSLASVNPVVAGASPKAAAAGTVFPTPTFPTPTSLPTAPTTAPRPADRKPAKKKGNSDMAVAALVCLVLVCLILVTVLVIVLSRGSA